MKTNDEEAKTYKRCKKCQIIHLHLRTLNEPGDMMWPDEKLNCGMEYKDHWGAEPPPELVALVFMTPAEVQELRLPLIKE